MKNFYTLIALSLAFCAQLSAQAGKDVFDPGHDPIALRTDTNTLELLVSEYVLAKSVKTSLGRGCQVSKTYKTLLSDGTEHLIFEGSYLSGKRQPFMLDVLLLPDAKLRFYYASSQTVTTCATLGCNNCALDAHGKCIGCCDPLPNGFAGKAAIKLLKVPSTIDE